MSNQQLKKKLTDIHSHKRCQICGISEWHGKPITLQLDHINGINNDNRYENLRLICPNCHSQTITYAGRNKYWNKFFKNMDEFIYQDKFSYKIED
jgi:5-methylcytosine-specific restriction endonuclease McrA